VGASQNFYVAFDALNMSHVFFGGRVILGVTGEGVTHVIAPRDFINCSNKLYFLLRSIVREQHIKNRDISKNTPTLLRRRNN
jgi:hypothetical protein